MNQRNNLRISQLNVASRILSCINYISGSWSYDGQFLQLVQISCLRRQTQLVLRFRTRLCIFDSVSVFRLVIVERRYLKVACLHLHVYLFFLWQCNATSYTIVEFSLSSMPNKSCQKFTFHDNWRHFQCQKNQSRTFNYMSYMFATCDGYVSVVMSAVHC